MLQRDLFNKTSCDNTTKSKDEIVIRCNNDYYKWKKREEELLMEIKKLKTVLCDENCTKRCSCGADLHPQFYCNICDNDE